MNTDLEDLRALIADIMRREPTDEQLWATLGDLGLTSIGSSDESADGGDGLAELVVVVEELAAHGVNLPLIECNTGGWAAGIGSRSVTTVGCADERAQEITVAWAGSASQMVLLRAGAARPQILSLGGRISPCHDPLRPHDRRVDLRGAILRDVETGPGMDEIRTRLALLRAAALVGATRATYVLTREYLRGREQFGKPLVRIPAVAQSLATIRVDVIQSEAALSRALELRTLDAAAIARVVAAESAGAAAKAAHQLHGAMGVTQEYPLHRLTRNIWAWRDADTAERNWAAHIGDIAFAGGEESVWAVLTATS